MVLPVYCDVTDPESVDELVNRAIDTFGKIDILFTAAGMAHRERLVEMETDDWQQVMDVNLKGTLICCRAVAKTMIEIPDERLQDLEAYKDRLGELLLLGLSQIKIQEALVLYKRGLVSFGRAAELAGLPEQEMMYQARAEPSVL